ncbi:MAG: hypothetical protein KDH98_25345, partial [Calditrichaeota bacterium]|nr:hypothetical protein [Calditrichota bacterium]
VDSMRLFQEDFRLRNGVYASGTWNPDGGVTTLATNLGWQPDGADGSITYVVTNNAGVSWTVVATDSSGTSITRTYPN